MLRSVLRFPTMARGLLTLLLGLVLAASLAPGQLRPAAAADAAPTAAHGTSDPLWFPLRTPASVRCAVDDCPGGAGHHYWAIDFIGRQGDPIYAAGAGIAHVGDAPGPGCGSGGDGPDSGNWIWIDHGGGLVTKYHHVNTILIKNGQRVSPATEIATMGHSGDVAPCRTNYLHFEIRRDGLTGARVAIPAMSACTGKGRVSLPGALGGSSWNTSSIVNKRTPAGSNACLSGDWTRTAAAPGVSLSPGATSMKVSWGARPAGTDGIVVRVERYSTALHGYGRPYHYYLPASSTSKTFTGLTNGRAYRVVVAFHNHYGYSAWSSVHTTTPGAVPTAGGSPRYLTWPHGSYVHYGWNRSQDNGSAIYRYEVAIRCQASGSSSYGNWRLHLMSGTKDVYYNFTGLGSARTCQVRVHAKNSFGWGAWSSPRTVRR